MHAILEIVFKWCHLCHSSCYILSTGNNEMDIRKIGMTHVTLEIDTSGVAYAISLVAYMINMSIKYRQ